MDKKDATPTIDLSPAATVIEQAVRSMVPEGVFVAPMLWVPGEAADWLRKIADGAVLSYHLDDDNRATPALYE